MFKAKRGRRYKAYVRWFDSTSGEGMVRLHNGESIYLHFTSIEGWDKNTWSWPSKKDRAKDIAGRDCEVSIYENLYSKQVWKCKLLRSKQNAKRWFSARFKRCECCDQYMGINKDG